MARPSGWQSVRHGARGRTRRVRLQEDVLIPRPIGELTPVLTDEPERWFPRAIGFHVAGVPVHKRVDVEFGVVVRTATWAVVEFAWKASYAEKLFPTMRGKVGLTAAGAGAAKLTVSGEYEPPLGQLGEELDDSLLHAVAEMTVRELAQAIGRHLER